MNWNKISSSIQKLYSLKGLDSHFEIESEYMKVAFHEIETLWESQFARIQKVEYVMLSETPLWGKEKKYIYNPKTPFSQFFYKSDLETVTESSINDKVEFLEILADLGFIVLDLSPFPLNETDTSINYRTISKKDYFDLVENVSPFFIQNKLERIKEKSNVETTFFFRYARVKNLFQDSVSNYLKKTGFSHLTSELKDITQMGGGIDRFKLKQIITQGNQDDHFHL